MRRKLVLGNWKMHGSKAQVRQLLAGLAARIGEVSSAVDVGVCPTHLHIPLVADLLAGSRIGLGAQDAYADPSGAVTGAVSVSMLVEFGVSWVLVGHSERRQLFGETDQQVATKFAAVLEQGLVPVLCVGETLQQRQEGDTETVVLAQLQAVINKAGIEALGKSVLAYEPVWAIGTGETASPAEAQIVHQALRAHMAAMNAQVAADTRIIYGGSVKGSNAQQLFEQADIDGGLIGGASLEAEEFISICKNAD
jgi:triosephosphate isomerase